MPGLEIDDAILFRVETSQCKIIPCDDEVVMFLPTWQ